MRKNADKSAFVVEGVYDPSIIGHGSATGFIIAPQPGLTKREYFTAMAMQGILSSPIVSIQTMSVKDKALYAANMADHVLIILDKPEP